MFLVMYEATAQELRDATDGLEHRLDPRLIEGGEHAGLYALNADVIDDHQFDDLDPILEGLPVEDLDPNEAFPHEE